MWPLLSVEIAPTLCHCVRVCVHGFLCWLIISERRNRIREREGEEGWREVGAEIERKGGGRGRGRKRGRERERERQRERERERGRGRSF